MSTPPPIVFLPGFDGEAGLRREFLETLGRDHQVTGVTYPRRALGTLQAYLAHAMAEMPVDWRPVLVAESFSGLVAAHWASLDPRVRGLVLCGSFARNPVGGMAPLGAALPRLVKLGPGLLTPLAWLSGDPARRRWSRELATALDALPREVVSERLRLITQEDVGSTLAALRVPMLLVQFESDFVISPEARAHLEEVCHNAVVLRLPGPHFAIETRAEACARAIGEAIRGWPLQPASPT